MSEEEATEAATDEVAMTVSIEDGHTVIDVTGERDIAIVVRSETGEQIYLPPEDFADAPARGTPYESPYRGRGERADTPYEPAEATATPYQPADSRTQTPYDGVAPDATTGIASTPSGVRIVHPEPIADLRLLR